MENGVPLYPSDFEIDLDPLAQLSGRIHPYFPDPVGACYGNMCGVSNLLRLPRVLVAGAYQDIVNNLAHARAIEAAQHKDLRAEVQKAVTSDEAGAFVAAGVSDLFAVLMQEVETEKLLQSQLCLALVIAWSSVEILADDLWDSLPTKLTSEINRAAKYGRPSFKQCKAIRGSYKNALHLEAHDLATFEKDELLLLEHFRHCFVHKGGLIDQKFMNDTTGNALLPAEIAVGHQYLPSSVVAQDMICSAIYACAELISTCERQLAAPKT